MIFEDYTVLVVDDIEENRELLSRKLMTAGFKTELANNGQAAMDVLYNKNISLVLLDIMMPEVDGITLLSQIRTNSKFADVPVIMVTAIDVINVAQECLKKGACGYVTKPYDFDLIKQKIRKCLKLEPRLVS